VAAAAISKLSVSSQHHIHELLSQRNLFQAPPELPWHKFFDRSLVTRGYKQWRRNLLVNKKSTNCS
jgi:hypothetical protein